MVAVVIAWIPNTLAIAASLAFTRHDVVPVPRESWFKSFLVTQVAHRTRGLRFLSIPVMSIRVRLKQFIPARLHPPLRVVLSGYRRLVLRRVAFSDFRHGQTGVAPNAIELHPILDFACLSG